MGDPAFDIDLLSHDERLDLLERLWESLRQTPSRLGLGDRHKEELDRRLDRLDRLDAEGPTGIPWGDILEEMDASEQ